MFGCFGVKYVKCYFCVWYITNCHSFSSGVLSDVQWVKMMYHDTAKNWHEVISFFAKHKVQTLFHYTNLLPFEFNQAKPS